MATIILNQTMWEDNKKQENETIIWKMENSIYTDWSSDFKNLITNNCPDNDKIWEVINTRNLSKAWKRELYDIIERNKELIIKKWNGDPEFIEFCSKFSINQENITESVNYFWWYKILNYIFNNLSEKKDIQSNNYIFISTKFLWFIKWKWLWIEDLLKITIILKNIIIDEFLNEDLKMVNHINSVFDEISANLSKNYNEIIIKILDEYTNAINNSNIITKTDVYGKITFANDEFCKLSWFTREELLWKDHNIVRHPDMPKEVFRDLRDTIQSKKIWKWIIKNKKKDGSTYWVQATIAPILWENDNIIEYISIRTDITELKETYKNLEEYSNALNTTNMVLKLDNNGKIIDVNETLLSMVWYKREELVWKCYAPEVLWICKDCTEWCHIPQLQEDQRKEINLHMSKKMNWKWVIKNKWKHWNNFWTSTNIIPILWLSNEINEYIILQNDVTDLEIAKQKFKAALSKQKEVDVKKDEFLNIASHELRTPMTSIKWYLSMILDWDAGEINSEVRQYLEQVYKSSNRLLMLINDMLDISKIESGKQEFTYEKIEIGNLIRETCSEMKTLFENKRQKLEIIIDFDKFEYNTDINKLRQVLLNIIWNANKFTKEEWTIKINVEKNQAQLIIRIKDDWIWIAEENIPKIFEKFWQVKNSLTRDINGTWLWLPIAKTIIEKMWWYIWVSSQVGIWTEFSINLPIKS